MKTEGTTDRDHLTRLSRRYDIIAGGARATLAVLDAIDGIGCFDAAPPDEEDQKRYEQGLTLLHMLGDRLRADEEKLSTIPEPFLSARARIDGHPDAAILDAWDKMISFYGRAGREQQYEAASETLIRTPAKTLRGAILQLWEAFRHTEATITFDEQLHREEFAAVYERWDDLDWHQKAIVTAIRTLESMEARNG